MSTLKKTDLTYDEKLTIRRALEVYERLLGLGSEEKKEAERLQWLIKDAETVSVYTPD